MASSRLLIVSRTLSVDEDGTEREDAVVVAAVPSPNSDSSYSLGVAPFVIPVV